MWCDTFAAFLNRACGRQSNPIQSTALVLSDGGRAAGASWVRGTSVVPAQSASVFELISFPVWTGSSCCALRRRATPSSVRAFWKVTGEDLLWLAVIKLMNVFHICGLPCFLLLHIHYITRPNFEPFWSKHTREVKHDTSCFVGVKIRTQYSSVNSLTWCLNPAKNSFCTCVWSTALLFLPNILLDKLHIIISVFLFVCLFYFLIFKTNYVTTNTLSRAYILLGTFVVCIMLNWTTPPDLFV